MIIDLLLQLSIWLNGVVLGAFIMNLRIGKKNDSYWRSIYHKEADWNEVLYNKLISAYKQLQKNIDGEHWKDPKP